MVTRIILVDDHRIVREGLRSLLSNMTGCEVIAEATDGRTAVRLVNELSPNLVIMDVAMPDLNGFEATRKIKAHNDAVRVIGLSMHADVPYVARMLQAGASAYLLKDCAFDELAEAMKVVVGGGMYLGRDITGIVVDDYVRKLGDEARSSVLDILTPKEKEVLQSLAEGNSSKEIGAALHISVKTVETHRQKIMNKLNLRSVAELTKFAVREGLTSLD